MKHKQHKDRKFYKKWAMKGQLKASKTTILQLLASLPRTQLGQFGRNLNKLGILPKQVKGLLNANQP